MTKMMVYLISLPIVMFVVILLYKIVLSENKTVIPTYYLLHIPNGRLAMLLSK